MPIPHINTKATNVEMTPQLAALIEEKVRALEKFIPKDETDIACDIEVERTTHRQSGKIYRVEMNMRVAGTLFRAEATEETIEDALFHAKNEMKSELRRTATRRQSLIRRGGQRIKDLMRFGR